MNVIHREGRVVGQMTDAGAVQSGYGPAGRVAEDGKVYDPLGNLSGIVDGTGLLFTTTGEMAGHVDPEGNVWLGERLLGRVAGSAPKRAAGALRFLLLEPARPPTPPAPLPPPAALPPTPAAATRKPTPAGDGPPASSGGETAIVAVASLALIGFFFWLLPQVTKPSAPPPRHSYAAPMATPAAVSRPVSTRATIEARYRGMDTAYTARNSDLFFLHHDFHWKFHDLDGTVTNLRQARDYHEMRFSSSGKNRFLSCSMTERIESYRARGNEVVVKVAQEVRTRTRQGRKRTDIRQEDTWRKHSGDWWCVRSRLISRRVTTL